MFSFSQIPLAIDKTPIFVPNYAQVALGCYFDLGLDLFAGCVPKCKKM
jgi:hypothetical protein